MKTNAITCHAVNFMPSDPMASNILRERAKQIAKETIKDNKIQNVVSYIKFRLGEHEYYGIPYKNIQEVTNKATLTRLPGTPECIAGVINHRGILLTIIDLKKFMGLAATDYQDNHNIIMVKESDIYIGILVDSIESNNEYTQQMIKDGINYTGIINPQYILGLHEGLTTILNVKNIMIESKQLLGNG